MSQPRKSLDTRTRLLEAAARVFARSGLAGSTTRAIAKEAGVNEVTLFRHFGTKDGLLAAVVGTTFESKPDRESLPTPTADLRQDLLDLTHRYETLLMENLPLVRTLLGEIQHRHREQERTVFQGIFGPVKASLTERIAAAQQQGELSVEPGADLLADLLAGMILTGVLRRSAPRLKLAYTAGEHRDGAVDLFLRGATRRSRQ